MQAAAIFANGILHDCQPKPGSRLRFIDTAAALQRRFDLVRCQTRAIIFYQDFELSLLPRNRGEPDIDMFASPFARILQQVADDLFKIFPLSGKDGVGQVIPEVNAESRIEFRRHALHAFENRRHRCSEHHTVTLRGNARALQIVLYLHLHRLALFLNDASVFTTHAPCFIDQHGKRGFERMGEIADLCSRPFDNTAIVFDQRIHFTGERRNFDRQRRIELGRTSLANIGQRLTHLVERTQAEQDHSGIDEDTADAENRQIGREAGSEIGYLLQNLAEIAHDTKTRNAIGSIQNHFGFNDEELLAVEAGQGVATHEGTVEGCLRDRHFRYDAPYQRWRLQFSGQVRRDGIDGPVPTGERAGIA